MYDKRPYQPIDQTPSRFLVDNLKLIDISDKPILDVACGYGRNGGYLAKNNHRVVFIDKDIECLRYIKNGGKLSEQGHVDTRNVYALYKNLDEGKLSFPNDSTGGVIDIHYYNPLLIDELIRVLDKGGFFCFESISARGKNVYELPDYHFIKDKLKNFKIISYVERKVNPEELGKSVMKVFAIKQYS